MKRQLAALITLCAALIAPSSAQQQMDRINVKGINSVISADFMGSGDCGSKINAADAKLGVAAGEIWVSQLCGTAWTTAFTISANHVLRFVQGGTYTTNGGNKAASNARIYGNGATLKLANAANTFLLENSNANPILQINIAAPPTGGCTLTTNIVTCVLNNAFSIGQTLIQYLTSSHPVGTEDFNNIVTVTAQTATNYSYHVLGDIAWIQRSSNVVTVQTLMTHNLSAGNTPKIANVVLPTGCSTAFNGTAAAVSIVDPYTFTYAQTGDACIVAQSGTVEITTPNDTSQFGGYVSVRGAGNSGMLIDDLILDGNRSNQGVNAPVLIWQTVSNSELRNLQCINGFATTALGCITIIDSTNVTVTNPQVSNSSAIGLENTLSFNTRIIGGVFSNMPFDSCISSDSGDGTEITGVKAFNCGASAISINDTNSSVHDNIIAAQSGANGNAITCGHNGFPGSWSSIHDNHLFGLAQDGVLVQGNKTVNVDVHDNAIRGAQVAAIGMANSPNQIYSAHNVLSSNQQGIFYNGCTLCMADHNVVEYSRTNNMGETTVVSSIFEGNLLSNGDMSNAAVIGGLGTTDAGSVRNIFAGNLAVDTQAVKTQDSGVNIAGVNNYIGGNMATNNKTQGYTVAAGNEEDRNVTLSDTFTSLVPKTAGSETVGTPSRPFFGIDIGQNGSGALDLTGTFTGTLTGTFANRTQTIGTIIGTGSVTTAGTAIGSGTCQAQTGITVSGAATGDAVTANIASTLPATWQTGIKLSADVSGSNTVTVSLCNGTAGSITPAATQVFVTVTR